MLSGDNGILQKATIAEENTTNSQITERIQLAYHAALTGGQGSYTKESLEDELEKEFGENNYNVDDSDTDNWILTGKVKEKEQNVTIPAGKVTILEPGLYNSETNDLIYSWNELIDNDILNVVGKSLYSCKDKTKIDGKLILDNSITAIANGAFSGCTNLKNIKIGNKVEIITNGAFQGTGLSEIVIPDSVTEVSGSAFNSCNNLKKVTLGNGLIKLGNGDPTFGNCTQLNSITIPHLEILGGSPFTNTAITSLILPEGLETITGNALCGFSGKVYLPRTISEIGSGVYIENNGQYNLTFYYAGTENEWNNINIADGNDDLTNSTIHYETTYSE